MFEHIKDIIPIIASISGFLAALAALFTVREVKRQRETALQPDLVMHREARFTITYEKGGSPEEMPLHWVPFDKYEGNVEQNPFTVSPTIPIFNVGVGAAKNVEVNLYLYCEEATTLIKELSEKHESKVSFMQHKGFLFFSSVANSRIMQSMKASFTQQLNFIANGKETNFYLPTSFTHCISAIAYLRSLEFKKNDENSSFDIYDKVSKSMPELHINITFSDIADKQYSVKYVGLPEAPEYHEEGEFNVGFNLDVQLVKVKKCGQGKIFKRSERKFDVVDLEKLLSSKP